MLLTNLITGNIRQLTYQQVRHARKTFRYRTSYGTPPLLSEDEYRHAEDVGKLNELSFSKIRFANVYETSSPLYDETLSKFVRFVMRDGRKSLADQLMHDTFYEVKCIQYARWRKHQSESAADEQKKEIAKNEEEEEEASKIEMNPLTIFKEALRNIEPIVVTRKVKRGGATYQVPYPLSQMQSEFLARFWILKAVLERPKPRTKNFREVMAHELLDAYYLRGKVIKRRDDMHKLAEANKAYAHYRWG